MSRRRRFGDTESALAAKRRRPELPGEPPRPDGSPAGVEAALGAVWALFPRRLFGDALPPVVLRHQLYSLVSDRTAVDRHLNRLRDEGRVRLLHLGLGPDTLGVVSLELYREKVLAAVSGSPREALVRRFLEAAVAASPELGYERRGMGERGFGDKDITYGRTDGHRDRLGTWGQTDRQAGDSPELGYERRGMGEKGFGDKDITYGRTDGQTPGHGTAPSWDTNRRGWGRKGSEIRTSRSWQLVAAGLLTIRDAGSWQLVAAGLLTVRDAGISPHFPSLRQLVAAGLLTVRDAGSWWLAVPGAGRFVRALIRGRRAVLSLVRRSRHAQVPLRELEGLRAP
ncbi:inactive serine/threonine-protein kinase 19 [Passerculus sandwichensis]